MLETSDAPNAVNTIEDVIRLLRERPDVREAARREILTDEILEMPKKLDELFELHRQMVMRQDKQDARMDKQDARMDKQDARMDRQDERLDNMENTQQRILETLAEHSRQLVAHSRMLGNLTGWATMLAAERRYPLIAMDMGLTEPRLLSIAEIGAMTTGEGASEYTLDQLNSFRDCDIIIAARNADVGECYIAVQVSSTIDHGDITRAIAHAGMVSRFTGCPAYPAVAGFSHAPIAEQRLAGDSIHWHRMPSSAMDPR